MSKILYAADARNDWGLFMPALLGLARRENASIHVLLTSAPIGTGNFTVNPTQNEAYPLETVNPAVPDMNPADRPAELTAPDTAVAAHHTNQFLEDLVRYFQEAGFEATGDWQPDFNREYLDVYARQVGAEVIAVARGGWLGKLFGGDFVSHLRDKGLRVEELEEADVDV